MSHKAKKERAKGKSLLELPQNYTLVDIETTGFSTQFDDIIEIGLIKMRGGNEIGRYQKLVKPSKPIPYVVERVTGIHNEMVSTAPIFTSIGKEVWDFLNGEIIVGHNINFDINFLYDKFEKFYQWKFQNDYVDTMRLAKHLVPQIKTQGVGNYGLDYLCEYLEIEIGQRHRAIGDCECTEKLLRSLDSIVKDKGIHLAELEKENRRRQKGNVNEMLKNLTGDSNLHDESHIFYGKSCVFTGKLELFTRVEAAQIVANIGGQCENSVTKRTNFLIVGDMDYKAGLEGYESSKLKKARKFIEGKQDLQIIPESAFYDLVGDYL